MDEFDDRGSPDVLITVIAQRSRGQQDDERAQAFAAAADDVLGHLRDQRYITLEARGDQPVDGLHFAVSQGADVFKSRSFG